MPAPDASVVHQRLSVPFTVAQALRHGRVTLAEFGRGAAADPALRAVMERIEVHAVPDIPPGAFVPVRLRVLLRDGATIAYEVTTLLGSPAQPLSRAERLAKVQGCWQAAGQPTWRSPDGLVRAVEDLIAGGRVDRVIAALPSSPEGGR
ncbi:MAG: hypothetical protein U0556_16855 [Dehalococcoidia bacterium]